MGIELGVLWASYYDDFPILEFSPLRDSSVAAVKVLTDLLGFRCAAEKELEFSQAADLLGIRFDLSEFRHGKVLIANKPGRVEALTPFMKETIATKQLLRAAMPSMLGRLLHADAQVTGRSGRLAAADLRVVCNGNKRLVHLSSAQVDALEWRAPMHLAYQRTAAPGLYGWSLRRRH